MSIANDVASTVAHYEKATPNPELARLQEFLLKMKAEGIAKPKVYDIAPPDTIGRTIEGATDWYVASPGASRRP